MMKQSPTSFAPSQLLMIPAGKQGTAFTPYALFDHWCFMCDSVYCQCTSGKRSENSRVSCKASFYLLAIYFCMLVSIGLFGSTAVARRFYLCTILRKS